MNESNWQDVMHIVCSHDFVENGSGYIGSLFKLVARNCYDNAKLSHVILRILHRLYKERETNMLRKAIVSPVYSRSTRTHIGWREDGAFIVWDGYHGVQQFSNERNLVDFLHEIESEIVFE